MKPIDIKRAKQIKKREKALIWWGKTALFGFLCGGVLYSCAANAYGYPKPVYRPHGHGQMIVVHDSHHHHMNPTPYILGGVVLGIVIYHIAQTQCNNGVICTKF